MFQTTPPARPYPRKTPKQTRSIETVRAIVEAAARILEDEGHGAFSTNTVAERAGVSVGSLYQYFPSKEALVGALVLRETTALIEDADRAIDHRDGHIALLTFIQACITHQFRRPRLARLLDYEEARLPFDPATQQAESRIHGLVAVLIAKPGLPPQPDPEIAVRDLIAIIKGIVDAAGRVGEPDQDAVARRVRHAALGYLENSRTGGASSDLREG